MTPDNRKYSFEILNKDKKIFFASGSKKDYIKTQGDF